MQIFSFNFNESLFLENQILSFKKFIKDEISFTCIDNSYKQNIKTELKDICSKYNVNYEDTNNKQTDVGSQSHGRALNHTLRNIVRKEDQCFLVDGDVYAIGDIELSNHLNDVHFAGVYQKRDIYEYMHPGFLLINTPIVNINELDMAPGAINGINVDTGGKISVLAKKYNYSLNFLPFNNLYNKTINYPESHLPTAPQFITELESKYETNFGIEIVANKLIHFRGGSRWNNDPLYERKFEFFNEYLKRSLS